MTREELRKQLISVFKEETDLTNTEIDEIASELMSTITQFGESVIGPKENGVHGSPTVIEESRDELRAEQRKRLRGEV